jgi:hypothetical protein
VETDVSEKYPASIFTVEVCRYRNRLGYKPSSKEGGLETQGEGVKKGTRSGPSEKIDKMDLLPLGLMPILVVTFPHNQACCWNLHTSTLKTVAACSSETSVSVHKTTQCPTEKTIILGITAVKTSKLTSAQY